MKLFNKTIDRQLFKQYSLGSDLSKQEVIVKIFNPYGNGTWYIVNSDPQDPDYLWAIVDLGYGAEVGSVSRNDLESYRGKFGLGFERDLSFDSVNAKELLNGLSRGESFADGGNLLRDRKFLNHSQDYEVRYSKGKNRKGYGEFADGGNINDFSDNQRMIMNQNVEVEHHHEELEDILEDEVPVPAWVVAKMETATQNLSDITHYLDGEKELMEEELEENEGEDEDYMRVEDFDYSKLDPRGGNSENIDVVEPINVSAGTKAELTKKFTDDALGNLKGFLKGMEGVDLREDYTFDYKDEQFEIEPIINTDDNGISNAVFTIFDGDGEEVGEVTYSREGGKQKFTANSEFFSWNNTKFEDGGFMNDVYTYGGQVRVGDKFKSNWTDSANNKGFDVIQIMKHNVTSAKDFKTKVMITEVIDSSNPKRIGVREEEYKPNFKKNISYGLYEPLNVRLENPKEENYENGGGLENPYDVIYTTTSGRTMVARRIMAKNEDEAIEKLKKQMQMSSTFDEVIMANESFADGGFMSNVYAKGGMSSNNGDENEGYNLKDINGKKIEVGDTVKTTQPSGGLLSPANSEVGIVEKTKDAFGQNALQIKYRKQGTNYDRFILLNGKVNEIVSKSSSSTKGNKYIDHSDIKTVTVKRNGKEVTYKGADVLNGVNILEDGGDLQSKANYIPKRDVVEVELNDGAKIKPANGYWVKKGAKAIGEDTTPTSSSTPKSKLGQTSVRKDARGNWRAETTVDDFNGYDWRISTVKTYSGKLISSAQGGKTEDSGTKGISMFKYTMYEDPNHTLEVSAPKRLMEKTVTEQHDKALAKFKKFMETGMFKGGGKISNFDKLSAKVAKEYEGKAVKSKFQEEYGKYYSRQEAKEVGDKVAGKVKAMYS